MHQNTGRWRAITGGLATLSLIAACSGTAPTPITITAPPVVQPTPITVTITAPPVVQPTPITVTITPAPTPIITAAPLPPGGKTADGLPIVRWFVGLGTGGNPEQIAAEQAAVAAFNTAHAKGNPDGNPEMFLSLEIYTNAVAYQTLATQIATGNSPDIIGPIGIRALQSFGDQLLDIQPYITSSGVDLSDIDPALVDVYKLSGKQIGIPMAVYPTFIYYNKDIFDEAELAYPPHAVGELYDGKPWTYGAVRDLALKLTVDTAGNDATSADFDPENVQTWGLESQWTDWDARSLGTHYGGSGSILAADGTTAQFPQNWRDGLDWWYKAIHTDHITPSRPQVDGLAGGNSFQSGRIAMDLVHMWYVCCVNPPEGAAPFGWDVAVMPAHADGSIVSKLHADTIGILGGSRWPEEAFEGLIKLAADATLTTAWGALPAIASQQEAFYASLDERFAPLKIDFRTVVPAMLKYPDSPSHEAFMPNFARADALLKALGNNLASNAGLDVQATLDEALTELQAIFDEDAT